MTASNTTHWVFGYGSLMWRPGFKFVRSEPALLYGYHRSLCVYSHVHRGTVKNPGLVFGLDHGGSCRGMAFEVDATNWTETVDYLRQREQATAVYLERNLNIHLANHSKQNVTALTFIVDNKHLQYAGKLPVDEQLKFIRQGIGQSGPCAEYVLSTTRHLEELGVKDNNIQALASRLTSDEPSKSEG